MSVTAIFGGTFNPLHIGHYQIISCLSDLNFIDRILVIPTKIPPHKSFDFAENDKDRIKMCRIACADFKKAEVSLVEINRGGKSYTIDTVKQVKRIYPEDKIYVTVGGDMLDTLDTWYRWQELIKEVSFIAFSRVGAEDVLKSAERMRALGADILLVQADITEVSSTLLRERINPQLLPEKIYDYIKKRKLYLHD